MEQKQVYLHVQGPREYYKGLKDTFGPLWGLTDSHYPVVLAGGWSDSRCNIYVLSIFENRAALVWHEVGHCFGLKHVKDRKNIMYPWITRGTEGIEDLKAKTHLWRVY